MEHPRRSPPQGRESQEMIEELVANPAGVDALLDRLDRTDPRQRAEVLESAGRLLDNFVVPAADLLMVAPDGTRYYDLDALSGQEIPGLVLGLLGRALPELDGAADDAQAQEALAQVDLEIPDAHRRERFLRAWAASRAARLVQRLLSFLDDNLDDQQTNGTELDGLRRLLERPVPSLDSVLMTAILGRRTKR